MNQYETRPYAVRLLLATPDAPRLWDYTLWSRLVPDLTPLLSSDRGRTSLRMTQLDRWEQGSPNQTYVRFGPVGWNEKSHRKWTHRSPDTGEYSAHWEFVGFSAWSPGPGKCKDCPPDGFLAVRNMAELWSRQCAYTVLAAAACDLPGAKQKLNRAFSALCSAIPSVLLAETHRSWSGAGATSLTNCDTWGAPFKPGAWHKAPALDLLQGQWCLIAG